MSDQPFILRARTQQLARVEVCRSFTYKLNCANYGGQQYESRDFFCSEKAECAIEDAPEVSAALYHFCKREVLASVKDYLNDMGYQRKQRTA